MDTSKEKKVKSVQGRKRYQLFEQSSKKELLKVFKDGLVHLAEAKKGEDNGNEGDNSFSLEFESDDEDVPELPKDDGGGGGDKENLNLKKGLFCGSCNVTFGDVAEQRLHYTLDWHRYNLKKKLVGHAAVGEGDFNDMIDDLSSIEGSDDEDEERQGDDQNRQRLEKLVSSTLSDAQQPSTVPDNIRKLENTPKLFFRNNEGKIVTCYKTILTASGVGRQARVEPNLSLEDVVEDPLKITIIMLSGGHFAAAVFDGNTCTHHKTFHSYTIRAKQGGSQGGHDAKSGTKNAKSAGASLRRYNQQSFTQHVQDLLDSWKGHITSSDLVFYRAAGNNTDILFRGKNPPFNKDSINLRTIPFQTKRPTFNEVKRVHSFLTTIHVYDSLDEYQAAHSHHSRKNRQKVNNAESSSSPKKVDRAKSRSPKRKDPLDIKQDSNEILNALLKDESDSEPTELELVDEVIDFNDLKEFDDSLSDKRKEERARKRKNKKRVEDVFKLEGPIADLSGALTKGDLDTFKVLLKSFLDLGSDINQPIEVEGLTLLHYAAKQSYTDAVWLLLEGGCDPTIKDKSGKLPYNYAFSKNCRETFRRFMGQYPERYDYKKAQVPPPLSEEEEQERAEKKKLLNKLKREKEKQKKAERYEKEKETEEQTRFLKLSDREKRALAAEQRILAQCKRNSEKAPVLVRCFECASDMTGKVPFEYNQNVFCTSKCLAAHRKKFPCPLSVQ